MKGFTVFAPPPSPQVKRKRGSGIPKLPFHLAGEGTATIRLKNLAYWDFSGLFKINVDKN